MKEYKEHHLEDGALLIQGEALEVLKTIESNSIHAIVTDPPYGLSSKKPAQVAEVLKAWVTGDTEVVPAGKGFMGKDWDGFVPPPAVWEECLRVLKPGGHMAVFAGARTQDLMGLSIRLAGFDIRDTLGWIYGSGFPKSMNVSKAIDRAAGKLKPESTGFTVAGYSHNLDKLQHAAPSRGYVPPAPATPEAEQWNGWGTALKPAIEPIILARKPLEGTVANNVLTHGVGGINIDASRIATTETLGRAKGGWGSKAVGADDYGSFNSLGITKEGGRFPANVLLDEHTAEVVDEQSGNTKSQRSVRSKAGDNKGGVAALNSFVNHEDHIGGYNDSGGASRFFPVFKYQSKAPKKERPVVVLEDGTKIQHPTVKPVALMEWLVTLITPPGGTVLDPFTGSGTTLEAAHNKDFNSIGIEREEEYVLLVEERFRKTGEINNHNQ